MRRAKFLGVIDDIGGELKEVSMGGHSLGDVFVVFFNTGNSTFPWRDSLSEDINATYFRTEELEFLPEKELDLNDYL
jgi:hypothetical protein